jgi:membrane protein implicated in regulation of membrane protease activity
MNEELKMILIICVGVVLVATPLFFIMSAGLNQLHYVNSKPMIEQLRKDSKDVTKDDEDVVGQITKTNMDIARHQSLNQIFIYQLLIPNGWDEIEMIKMPEKEQ